MVFRRLFSLSSNFFLFLIFQLLHVSALKNHLNSINLISEIEQAAPCMNEKWPVC